MDFQLPELLVLLEAVYSLISSVGILLDKSGLDQIIESRLHCIDVLISLLEDADLLFHHLESVKLFLERFLPSYLSCLFILNLLSSASSFRSCLHEVGGYALVNYNARRKAY